MPSRSGIERSSSSTSGASSRQSATASSPPRRSRPLRCRRTSPAAAPGRPARPDGRRRRPPGSCDHRLDAHDGSRAVVRAHRQVSPPSRTMSARIERPIWPPARARSASSAAMPRPSSVTSITARSPSRRTVNRTCAAPACASTLRSASWRGAVQELVRIGSEVGARARPPTSRRCPADPAARSDRTGPRPGRIAGGSAGRSRRWQTEAIARCL